MRRGTRWVAALVLSVVAGAVAACGPVTQVHPCSCYGLNLENTFAAPPYPANHLTAGEVARLRVVWSVPTRGVVSSPPAVGARSAYFDSWGGVVYRVRLVDGAVLWRHAFPTVTTGAYGVVGFAGSPAVGGGRVFVTGADGRVYALAARSGRLLWQTDIRRPGETDFLWGGPQAWRGRLFVGVSSAVDTSRERGRVVALSTRDGRVLWDRSLVAYRGGGASVVPVAAVDPGDGLIYVATGNPTPEPDNTTAPGPTPPGPDLYSDSIVALRAKSGRLVWYHQTTPHDSHDLDFIASVNLFPTSAGLAAGDGQKNGVYYALDAQTGRLLWQRRLAPPHTDTSVVATAACSAGRIFVPTIDVAPGGPAFGRLVALDAASGRILWVRRLPAPSEAAPVVVGGFVFVADDAGDVFALQLATGRRMGAWHFGGAIWGGLSAVRGLVLVPVGGAHPRVVALGTA